jgi:glycosyltransferase involved in cell wall biosynthesis
VKIAFVAVKGIPYGGGVEHVTEEIGSRLVNRGHEVTVYCSNRYCTGGFYRGMRLRSLPSLKHPYLDKISLCLYAMFDLLFNNETDIVHLHSVASMFAVLARISGIRTVAHIHSFEWKKDKWSGLVKFFLKLSEYVAARFADRVIVVSGHLYDYFCKKYKKNTLLLPSGVGDVDYQAPFEMKEFALSKNNYILYIGRLSREKGVHHLLDAYGKLSTDKMLVLAGEHADDGKYRGLLRQKIDQNDNIIHVGYVRGDIKAELFSNAYLVVFPGEVEGSPVALMEAMSYGNCCLVSEIPENLSVLNGNGYSFKNKSVDNLRDALSYLLSHKNAVDRHKEDARKYVLKNFNWDDIVNTYEKMCFSLANHVTTI